MTREQTLAHLDAAIALSKQLPLSEVERAELRLAIVLLWWREEGKESPQKQLELGERKA